MKLNRWVVVGFVALLAFGVFLLTHGSSHTEYRHGRVIDEGGMPIAGAHVQMSISWQDLDESRVGFSSFTRTDAAGAFAVSSGWRDGVRTHSPWLDYDVDLEACHRDFIPVRHPGRDYHQNKGEIILTLAKRSKSAASYPWNGMLTWGSETEIQRNCRLKWELSPKALRELNNARTTVPATK